MSLKDRITEDLRSTMRATDSARLAAIRFLHSAIAECGSAGAAAIGPVMAVLKQRIAGRADMGQACARVKSRLGG